MTHSDHELLILHFVNIASLECSRTEKDILKWESEKIYIAWIYFTQIVNFALGELCKLHPGGTTAELQCCSAARHTLDLFCRDALDVAVGKFLGAV